MLLLMTIFIILILIIIFNIHPFIAIIIATIFLGIFSPHITLSTLLYTIEHGFGNIMSGLGMNIALGTIFGTMLLESGATHKIAQIMLNRFTNKQLPLIILAMSMMIGLTVFFDVGFFVMLPILYSLASSGRLSILTIALPAVMGLSIVHGLFPPHPGIMIATLQFNAHVAKTIIYAFIVAIPSVLIVYCYIKFICHKIEIFITDDNVNQINLKINVKNTPNIFNIMITILLPILLILNGLLAKYIFHESSLAYILCTFLGQPVMALLIAVVFSFFSFGIMQGHKTKDILNFCNLSLSTIASVILILGAGGALNAVIIASGVGAEIAQIIKHLNCSLLILAWLIAALMRVATGSATLAIITTVGIMNPIIIHNDPNINRELLVLAAGAGSIMLSHINDAGFWLVKQYLGMSVKQTLVSWTVIETLLSVCALGFILIINNIKFINF